MKNGKHLIIDAYGCDPQALWDVDTIKNMLLDVTRIVGLRPLSETLIYEVDESMIELESTGITGGIIFMESHFTFHAFPEKNYFSADIYSCNSFEHEKVVKHISKLFSPANTSEIVLIRGSQLDG